MNPILRTIGLMEKVYIARQALGICNSVIVTATYTVSSTLEDAALSSILCTAIASLLQRHPFLCCYFEGEETPKPLFRCLDKIHVKDVLQVVDLTNSKNLAQELEELHDQRWSTEQKPLWKLVVMRESQIVGDMHSQLHLAFVYHHAIGDGLSGVAFHRSLLHELGNIGKIDYLHELPETIDTPASTKLIEPVEKLTSFPLSWAFFLRRAIQEYAPVWLIGQPPSLWAGLPIQSLEDYPFRSRIRIVAIERKDLEMLLEKSKSQTVTLTALLTATLVSALANALPEALRFLGVTPYSLRRWTGTSIDEMAIQISALETHYPIDILDRFRRASNTSERTESLWFTARYFNAQMQEEFAKCPRDNIAGLLPYVTDFVEFYRKKFGKAREATFEVSNVGVFAQESQAGEWTLSNMTFTQGALPAGPAFAVNCASVKGGPLTIAITWQHSVVDEVIIVAVAQGFADLPDLVRRQG